MSRPGSGGCPTNQLFPRRFLFFLIQLSTPFRTPRMGPSGANGGRGWRCGFGLSFVTQDNSELRKKRILSRPARGRCPTNQLFPLRFLFSDSIIVSVSAAADGTFGGKRRPRFAARWGTWRPDSHCSTQVLSGSRGARWWRPDAVCGGAPRGYSGVIEVRVSLRTFCFEW